MLIDLVVNCTISAAFEYCGQKCSAVGRMYVPDTLWPQVCLYSVMKHGTYYGNILLALLAR
jgi:acyl-CoA reductase-like NAD-dependent aldehyde dehydrogenase